MKTVYFVYSDVWAHDGWHLHGIFSEEDAAKQYMLKWAERDYNDYKQYCANKQKEYGDGVGNSSRKLIKNYKYL